jgi:hypothetical protein
MRVGLIRPGRMGRLIARSLLKVEHELVVYNRKPGRADAQRANGARVASAPAEACASELVITMLDARKRTSGSDRRAVVPRFRIRRLPSALSWGIAFVALTGLFGQADAAICKYVGRDGRITYSNLATRPQGGSKVECFEFPASVSASPAAPGPADAERLTADAEDRRALEQQLADEEERLEEAQRALSEQQANLGADDAPDYYSLGPFVDAVRAHRRKRDEIRHKLVEHRWDRGASEHSSVGIPVTRQGDVWDHAESTLRSPALGDGAPQTENHPADGSRRLGGGWTGSRPESGRR